MRNLLIGSILALTLGAASASAQTTILQPAQAIKAVTDSPKGEVAGVFEFHVVSTGASGFNFYLNSSEDYRQPSNLSVEIHAAPANEIRAKMGDHPDIVLKGKHIRVKGTARRVTVGDYFQTRIDVDSADQIEILG